MFKTFIKDESGAAAAEYALLLAIIAAGLGVAATSLGDAIFEAFENTTDCINDSSTCTPTTPVTP